MTAGWVRSAVILVALATTLQAQDRTDRSSPATLLKSLESIDGLTTSTVPSQYDSSTIDQFDAVLSPQLKLYGLKSVTRQKWSSAGGAVEVTLFEMLDSGAAYGIYTLQQSRPGAKATPTLLGAASFRQANRLHFWQSNYIVQVTGPLETQNQVAETLARNIPGQSRKPPVSEYLPPENLVEGSEKYLLSEEAIDTSAGLDPTTLGFDSSAEAATATYRVDGSQAKLLLVLYPTQHIAKKYAEGMQSKLKAAFTKRAGPLLAIVYGSNSEKVAASILDDISHEFKVTWDEPPPGLGLGTMLITIFTFIGLSLAFTTMAGISFGGLRVFVKSRYGNRVFDRPEAMEIIQLKLGQGVTSRQISANSDGGNT
jgi:hypothetical protein